MVVDSLEVCRATRPGELADAARQASASSGKALLVDSLDNENLTLASRNNPALKTVDALAVNVYDVVDRSLFVVSEGALNRLVEVLGEMRVQEIIRRPLITEKSTMLREGEQHHRASRWTRDANKIEVKRAVETQFKVKVAEVRIANVHGKVRRQGRFVGRRPDWKKAYVRLAEGEKPIEFFEGM